MKRIAVAVAAVVFAASTSFAATVYKASNGNVTLPDNHPKIGAPETFKGKEEGHGFCFKCHGKDMPKAKKCGECHKKDKK